jgi:hypothetical protein
MHAIVPDNISNLSTLYSTKDKTDPNRHGLECLVPSTAVTENGIAQYHTAAMTPVNRTSEEGRSDLDPSTPIFVLAVDNLNPGLQWSNKVVLKGKVLFYFFYFFFFTYKNNAQQ